MPERVLDQLTHLLDNARHLLPAEVGIPHRRRRRCERRRPFPVAGLLRATRLRLRLGHGGRGRRGRRRHGDRRCRRLTNCLSAHQPKRDMTSFARVGVPDAHSTLRGCDAPVRSERNVSPASDARVLGTALGALRSYAARRRTIQVHNIGVHRAARSLAPSHCAERGRRTGAYAARGRLSSSRAHPPRERRPWCKQRCSSREPAESRNSFDRRAFSLH
jgi:hypothetical protein